VSIILKLPIFPKSFIESNDNGGIICTSVPHQGSVSSPMHNASTNHKVFCTFVIMMVTLKKVMPLKVISWISTGTSAKTLIECNWNQCIEYEQCWYL